MMSFRLWLFRYFHALLVIPQVFVLVLLPVIAPAGADLLMARFALGIGIVIGLLSVGSQAAAQRQACFDWQTELTQFRREVAVQTENYRRLSEKIGTLLPAGQSVTPDQLG